MIWLYRLLDKVFDPPPKGTDNAGIMLYYETQEESYNRYKRLCYRKLILKSLLAFCLGVLFQYLFKLI